MGGITVKCPECGHRMNIDPKVIAFRCLQCGNKIDLDENPIRDARLDWPKFNKYNTAHTNRIVDEAEIIRAQTEYEKQKHLNDSDLFAKDPLKGLLVMGILLVIMFAAFGIEQIFFKLFY